MRSADTDLASLCAGMRKLPQHMINVPAQAGVDVDNNPLLNEAVAAAEKTLGERGRVLLRPSGTEPLVRVMIEGEDVAQHVVGVDAAEVELGGTRETQEILYYAV